jgi:hypothetical protein
MIAIWFLAGTFVGILSGLSQQWTVGQIHADSSRKVAVLLIGGFIFRLGLAGLVLFAAIQQGIFAALLAFAGLWIARWGLSLYWHKSRPYSQSK